MIALTYGLFLLFINGKLEVISKGGDRRWCGCIRAIQIGKELYIELFCVAEFTGGKWVRTDKFNSHTVKDATNLFPCYTDEGELVLNTPPDIGEMIVLRRPGHKNNVDLSDVGSTFVQAVQ